MQTHDFQSNIAISIVPYLHGWLYTLGWMACYEHQAGWHTNTGGTHMATKCLIRDLDQSNMSGNGHMTQSNDSEAHHKSQSAHVCCYLHTTANKANGHRCDDQVKKGSKHPTQAKPRLNEGGVQDMRPASDIRFNHAISVSRNNLRLVARSANFVLALARFSLFFSLRASPMIVTATLCSASGGARWAFESCTPLSTYSTNSSN